ncbi:MAG: hypothetical protein HY667_01420, partial [Chloroflexi bacterium]|nr:hypothetical protein [Chloroflexota bacterium]
AVSSDGRLLSPVRVSSEDGKVTLNLPVNTVSKAKDKSALPTVSVAPAKDVPPLPENSKTLGLPQELGPSGATFDPPITLSWVVDPAQVPSGVAEKDLILAFFDATTGKWVPVPSAVDTTAHTITGTISHFTVFAVIAPLPAPSPTPPTIVPQPSPTPRPTPPTVRPEPTPTPTPSPPTVVPAPIPTPAPAPPTIVPEPTHPPAPPVIHPAPAPSARINWMLVSGMFLGAAVVLIIVYLAWRRTPKR